MQHASSGRRTAICREWHGHSPRPAYTPASSQHHRAACSRQQVQLQPGSASWHPCARSARQEPRWQMRSTSHDEVSAATSSLDQQLRRRTLGRADIEREFRQGLVTSIDFQDPQDAEHAGACDLGLPDSEICSSLSTPPVVMSSLQEAWSRGRWLLGLLVLQSSSSFVLDKYEELLRQHIVVTLFLTMLVGAGGNAGNQSAIKVIRGLATGTLEPTYASLWRSLRQQVTSLWTVLDVLPPPKTAVQADQEAYCIKISSVDHPAMQSVVAVLLATALSGGGFARVYLSLHSVANATAISASLFMIVVTSIVIGTALPYTLARVGLDPANAGTTIQVLMDIAGVAITCVTCKFVLDQLAVGMLPGAS